MVGTNTRGFNFLHIIMPVTPASCDRSVTEIRLYMLKLISIRKYCVSRVVAE